MALSAADLEEVKNFIKGNLVQMLAEQSLGKPPVVYEIELRERMVRVEEELKHQRELMMQGFDRIDKRFEELLGYMNGRFEQVDKRFEQVERRIENLEKRMDSFMRWSFGLTVTTAAIVISVLKFT